MYPRVVIDLKKIKQNLNVIVETLEKANLSTMIVTKVICADEKIIDIIEKDERVQYFADSRIENIMSYSHSKKQKVLLRLPMISDVERVVRYADISLNSELETIKQLNIEAQNQDKIHKIILMIDAGDLREGIYFTEESKIYDTVSEILQLSNIKLYGIGVNLTCYGAVIPQPDNLNIIANYAQKIEDKFNIKLEIVSGGNSSSLHLIDKGTLPKKINNLRIGEAFYLANETAYSTKIKNMNDDAIILEAEVVELKEKPSLPVGDIGVDAFGKKPYYEDKGIIKRAIIAIGKQDVDLDSIRPIDEKIEILGGSSDHTILNVSGSDCEYKVGDVIKFKLGYSGLLKLYTSKYVDREYLE